MTINDMLNNGIVFDGTVEVRGFTDDEKYNSYVKCPWESMDIAIPKNVRNMEIDFIFPEENEDRDIILVIEVSMED